MGGVRMSLADAARSELQQNKVKGTALGHLREARRPMVLSDAEPSTAAPPPPPGQATPK